MKQLVLRAVMTFILCMVIVVSSMVLIFTLPVKAAYEEDESVSTYVTDKACSFSLFPWKVGGTPTTSIDKLKGTYTGDMVGGLAEGYGTVTGVDNSGSNIIYTGKFRNGTITGIGTMSYVDKWYSLKGHFTYGMYTPTVYELYDQIKDMVMIPYNLSFTDKVELFNMNALFDTNSTKYDRWDDVYENMYDPMIDLVKWWDPLEVVEGTVVDTHTDYYYGNLLTTVFLSGNRIIYYLGEVDNLYIGKHVYATTMQVESTTDTNVYLCARFTGSNYR